jgi:hypothetical protein
MVISELIEKLSKLDPNAEVMVEKEGCGCCEGYPEAPAVLMRRRSDGAILVLHPEEV